jgi:hypothetical protein
MGWVLGWQVHRRLKPKGKGFSVIGFMHTAGVLVLATVCVADTVSRERTKRENKKGNKKAQKGAQKGDIQGMALELL